MEEPDLILPSIGNLKMKDVTDTQLQKILNLRAGKSISHVSKLHQTIKGIFRQARISRLIIYDPSENLKMPKTTEGTHRSITDEERKYILIVANKHPAGLWVKMQLFCGVRPGETIALNWKDIDLKRARVNVSTAMESGKDSEVDIKAPKTTAGIRSVPIVDSQFLAELNAAKGDPFEPVFTKQKSKERHTHQSLRCLWRSFKNALDIEMGGKRIRRAKVENGKVYRQPDEVLSVVARDLVPYCLRHTYGTDLQDAGVPINVAKYLMGHEDITTTGNVYIDTTEDAIDDAAEKHRLGLGKKHRKAVGDKSGW